MVRSRSERKPRNFDVGFTLIEVMVSIIVVALLIALLVPAVLSSREASRRNQCAANLRQISTAVLAYESTHSYFPAGSSGYGASFLTSILPFIEQKSLYNSINYENVYVFNSLINSTASNTKVNTFLCPSDPSFTSGDHPGTNYCGNRGNGVQLHGYNGAFTVQNLPQTRTRDFIDGQSSTSLVCEWLGGLDEIRDRDARRGVFTTKVEKVRPEEFEDFSRLCGSLDPKLADFGAPPNKGSDWLAGEFGFSLYNHVLKPNFNSCVNGTAFQQGAWTAGSIHAGGVNLSFADGHVAFLKDSISIEVWRAIGSRNGHELIRDSEFD